MCNLSRPQRVYERHLIIKLRSFVLECHRSLRAKRTRIVIDFHSELWCWMVSSNNIYACNVKCRSRINYVFLKMHFGNWMWMKSLSLDHCSRNFAWIYFFQETLIKTYGGTHPHRPTWLRPQHNTRMQQSKMRDHFRHRIENHRMHKDRLICWGRGQRCIAVHRRPGFR